MKLNNNGWGYRDMIIYSCIILFALVIAAVSISSYYDSFMSDLNTNNDNNDYYVDDNNDEDTEESIVTDTDYYKLQEDKLKSATLDYVKNYSYDLTEDILVVSIDTLVSFGFIDPIYDQTGSNVCTGYSNVYLVGEEFGVVPYINCSNYVTIGY